ncbi:hypothetical protein [Halomonas sp. MMSF_3323]|uniref:hypothetical protein n=1 Tax=Halomonas sp. MMSF_3323 TaxID=3046701 RepID=UPI00273F354F|nr:hypothetical protein [Halomonas sp. MMSF_3323]
MIDPTSDVGRIRLLTGDIDEPYYFEDDIYLYYLNEGMSELEVAIEITNNIIAYLSLSPTRERTGSIEVYQQNLTFLQQRLKDMEKDNQAKNKIIPAIINPGQKSWCWLDEIFQNNKE